MPRGLARSLGGGGGRSDDRPSRPASQPATKAPSRSSAVVGAWAASGRVAAPDLAHVLAAGSERAEPLHNSSSNNDNHNHTDDDHDEDDNANNNNSDR